MTFGVIASAHVAFASGGYGTATVTTEVKTEADTVGTYAGQTADITFDYGFKLTEVQWQCNEGGTFTLEIDGVGYGDQTLSGNGVGTWTISPALEYSASSVVEFKFYDSGASRQFQYINGSSKASSIFTSGEWQEAAPGESVPIQFSGNLAVGTLSWTAGITKDSTSGGSFTAQTFTLTPTNDCTLTAFQWEAYQADDYTLTVGGASQGSLTFTANETKSWTGLSVALTGGSPTTFKIQGTANRRYHFYNPPGPYFTNDVEFGEWQEATGNGVPCVASLQIVTS